MLGFNFNTYPNENWFLGIYGAIRWIGVEVRMWMELDSLLLTMGSMEFEKWEMRRRIPAAALDWIKEQANKPKRPTTVDR